MYVATMAFVGVTSEHQWSSDTHMIIRHHLRPPPTVQQTQRYNTHNDTTYTMIQHTEIQITDSLT